MKRDGGREDPYSRLWELRYDRESRLRVRGTDCRGKGKHIDIDAQVASMYRYEVASAYGCVHLWVETCIYK